MIRKSGGLNFAVSRRCAEAIAAGSNRRIGVGDFSRRHSTSCRVRSIAWWICAAAANDHLLVFAIHHAIADGWSLGVFVEELFAAYIQAITGSSAAFAARPANLCGVGRGRARFLETGSAGTAPRVLESQAGRFAAGCGTPRSHPARPGAGSPLIPASLTNETRELARRTGVTFFSALFGAFQVAFSKWSGFDDLVVGHAGRQSHQANRAGNDGLLRGHCSSARANGSFAHRLRSSPSGSSVDDRLVCQRHAFR